MANCPKCNHKLRLIDWKPECPNCGVNVLYYDFEEQFYLDAKGSEIDAAKIRVKWARVKAAFIGGKIMVARLSLSILPLAAMLLSFGSLRMVIPLFEKKLRFSIIGLFSFFTDGTWNYLTALKSSEIVGTYAKHAVNIFFGLSAIAGFALLVFLFQLLCFISIKKMTAILAVTSGLGIAAAVWCVAAVYNFSRVTGGTIFTVRSGYGGFAVLIAFAVLFLLNMVIAKKGVPIHYTEGDLYRVEVAGKLKRGEISFDDLPQPVYSPDRAIPEPAAGSAPAEGSGLNGQ